MPYAAMSGGRLVYEQGGWQGWGPPDPPPPQPTAELSAQPSDLAALLCALVERGRGQGSALCAPNPERSAQAPGAFTSFSAPAAAQPSAAPVADSLEFWSQVRRRPNLPPLATLAWRS